MDTFDRVRDLPLEIESYELDRVESAVSSDFLRVCTVVRLCGRGEEGLGEDVTYDAEDHTLFQETRTELPLSGSFTLETFSAALERIDFFPRAPSQEMFRDYRRWAFESAALDLALRQARVSLADALQLVAQPVHFVVSLRLGDPPSVAPILALRKLHPELRFKLDPTSSWDEALIGELVATEAVVSLDFKGAYEGTIVDQPADPVLYRRVAEAFPDAWLEDPHLDAETDEILRPHRDRVTWDAPIHSVADIEGLPFAPRTINFKPSRFGTVRSLFEAYDHCRRKEIQAYGGGQFELGPGRGQIQYLAALFHASAPNDVAPGGYNDPQPVTGLPASPLEPAPADIGFRWASS